MVTNWFQTASLLLIKDLACEDQDCQPYKVVVPQTTDLDQVDRIVQLDFMVYHWVTLFLKLELLLGITEALHGETEAQVGYITDCLCFFLDSKGRVTWWNLFMKFSRMTDLNAC